MKSVPSITATILVLILPIAYKHFQIPDDQFNQVMGFLVGVLSQQGITHVKRARAAKKAQDVK